MDQKKRFVAIYFSIFTTFLFLPLVVFAFEFNPNFIISDEDATNYLDMTRKEIQNFLLGKKGKLSFYEALTKEGKYKTAANIINSAAHKYKISKRFLLTLIQREQSLITDDDPSLNQLDWATGYGICDSCDKADPALQRWRGFSQQIISAAAQFRDYFDNPLTYTMKKGNTTTIDNLTVTPVNQATTNLYIYTPHITGNKNFAKIWANWFGPSTPEGEKIPLPYPDGSLLKLTDEETVWYIKEEKRHPITSQAVLQSRFDAKKIISVTQKILEKYPSGSKISFHQYALVQDEQKNIYLIINDFKRKFQSIAIFQKIGYNPEEIIDATTAELSAYKDGFPITKYTLYPTGSLIQNNRTGGVYYVESNVKYPIVDRQLLKLYFTNSTIEKKTPEELETYLTGEPYKLRDGEVVMTLSEKTLYVISNGQRRPIASESVFNKMGYKWEQVVTVSETLLSIHPIGEKLVGLDGKNK
jgi:hypothetical protein